MDKQPIIEHLVARLEDELATIAAAARDAHAYATDEQSKSESKYDTRALESSYLAEGQARHAAELQESITALRGMPLRSWTDLEPIALGAYVEIVQGTTSFACFLAPRGGGMEVTLNGQPILVVTPQSPLGRSLLGQLPGTTIRLPAGEARILRVA
jgi:hypothetical protein